MRTLRSFLSALALLCLTASTIPTVRAAPGGSCSDLGTLWVTDDSDHGSQYTLRWMVNQANATPGPNRICFHQIMNGHYIALESDLHITDDDLTIDASPNWLEGWPSGHPGINLEGIHAPQGTVALRVSGARNFVVKGIQIWGAHTYLIPGFSTGIVLENGASGAVIGSASPGGRMLLNGMENDAVMIVSSNDNKLVGSYIGTSPAGNLPVANGGGGVVIEDGQRNQIGGGNGLEGNLIGASGKDGVDIIGSGAISNTVINNSIGIGSLSQPITNTLDGIHISNGASMNGIGGVVYQSSWGGMVFSATLGNTIYGSGQDGVHVEDASTHTNGILVSTIRGNARYGIHLDGANNSNTPGSNTVTNNDQGGIMLDNGASGNWVVANLVGTDQWGNTGQYNGHHGISMYGGAQQNTIQSNWVVASGWSGIVMVNPNTQKNFLVNNRVGVGPQGQAMGNAFYGVAAVDSPFNDLVANQIANNGKNQEAGVYLSGSSAVGNGAFQNSIHDNAGPGIALLGGANHNLAAPTITNAACPLIRGSGAPPNGTVQVFSDNADEGATYEGRVVADGAGHWSLATKWTGPHLTATASTTATVTTLTTAPVKSAPALRLVQPDGARSLDYPVAPTVIYFETSPFSTSVTVPACRLLYLPLMKR